MMKCLMRRDRTLTIAGMMVGKWIAGAVEVGRRCWDIGLPVVRKIGIRRGQVIEERMFLRRRPLCFVNKSEEVRLRVILRQSSSVAVTTGFTSHSGPS